jgi:anthranilate synthase component 1
MDFGPLHSRTLVADMLTPVGAYACLRARSPGKASFLFESVVGGERWGRFSILGYRPAYELVLDATGAWTVHGDPGDALDRIRGELDEGRRAGGDALRVVNAILVPPGRSAAGTPAERFARAHVGYLSWDFVHQAHRIPGSAEAGEPVGRFLGGTAVAVFDNLAQTVTLCASSRDGLDALEADLRTPVPLHPLDLPARDALPADMNSPVTDDAFAANVRRAQEYIAAGDAFQVVLARPFHVPLGGGDPFDAYRALRVLNPSPYMYFLDLPAAASARAVTIVGASPETLVRSEGGSVTVRPIAGTRPRGRTPEEDAALERELLADAKELAEHVMLIDLGRNDVGRVARTGTVEVIKRMVVERYSHVMHIVSEVTGTVAATATPFDVLRSAFPAGTLSGAPKIRAMQIIRELEGRPRGIYGGAVGWLGDTGDLDFAIAIRTGVYRDGVFTVTAGAGIVEASQPASEADETRNKARALLCAAEAARRAGARK